MVVEGEEVPEEVLRAEELAKDYAVPHVNFYDPSVYKVGGDAPEKIPYVTKRVHEEKRYCWS